MASLVSDVVAVDVYGIFCKAARDAIELEHMRSQDVCRTFCNQK